MTAPDRAAPRPSTSDARTPAPGVQVRRLVEADLSPVWELMREFAAFERLEHEFTGTSEALGRHLLHGHWPPLDAFVVEVDGTIGGFAIAYGVFSTFWTRPILWLEDLYVADRFRGRGAGRVLFAAVAALAHERGCARLDWAVLEWNQPAIEFYERLGAHRAGGWFTYRIPGEGLERFATEVARQRE